MRQVFIVLVLLVIAGGVAWRLRAASATRWRVIAPGVEMRTFSIRAPGTLHGRAEVRALRCAPTRLRVVAGSTQGAAEWRVHEKAIAVVNGGYFDEKGKSLGLRVCDGLKKSSLHNANWGVFFVRNDEAKVLHTRDFIRTQSRMRGIDQAVQCGPRLVVDGKTTDLKPQVARRTALGIQRDGRVIIAVTESPLGFDDWANLWAASDGLNCLNALNLDGGGSTQLSLKTSKAKLEIGGSWPVPDAIAIR